MKFTLNCQRLPLNKKLFLLALAGFAFSAANAQIQFGAKAGVNISGFTGPDASGTTTRLSFNVGALARVPIAESFDFQPELNYSGQGAKGTTTDPNSGAYVNMTMPLNYLNVPLLFKYSRPFGLFTETGPQVGFLMSAHSKVGGVSVDAKSAYKSTDFSWAFGLGYLSPANIGIDFRYNLGLSNIAKAQDGTTPNIKNASIQIGLFYMFGDSGRDQ